MKLKTIMHSEGAYHVYMKNLEDVVLFIRDRRISE